MTVVKLLLFASLAMLPIYLWSSGGVQIAHAFFALYCAAWVLLNRRLPAGRTDLPVLLLLGSVLVRESFAVLFGGPPSDLMPALQLLFCLVMFVVLRVSLQDSGAVIWLRRGVIVAALLAMASVVALGYGAVSDSEGERAVGSFNNPNQLGYFAVCLAGISGLLKLQGKTSGLTFGALLGISGFLAIASLSKGAMVAVALGGVFSSFVFIRDRRFVVVPLLCVCALLLVAKLVFSEGLLDEFKFVHRLQSIGTQDDDSLAGRGYIAWYQEGALPLLFGIGKSGVFEAVGHEVHSTIGHFFVTYGVIAGLLFVWFVANWCYRVWSVFGFAALVLVCAPPLLYGLTHNGSRFTIFWVLLGFAFAATERNAKRESAELRRGSDFVSDVRLRSGHR